MNRSSTTLLPRILLVEDERTMRMALHDCLAGEGYRVLLAENGALGLDKAISEKPDLILLDVMMPHIDGYTLARELRKLQNRTPILMLTARGEIRDRVAGLDSGADDYLVKPFSTDELLARVRSLLRRSRRESQSAQRIRAGAIEIHLDEQRVRKEGLEIHLTPKEFAMVRLMIDAHPEPVSRDRFLDAVWGYTAFPTTRTVDNHVAAIRQKLENDPQNPKLIKTVHGLGYRIELSENFAES